MSARDFATSFYIYYLPANKIKEYQEHIDSFEEYKKGFISFKEYVAFQYFLKKKDDIKQRVVENKTIGLVDLHELVEEFQNENDYCQNNQVHISDKMLQLFIRALDIKGTGVLGEE